MVEGGGKARVDLYLVASPLHYVCAGMVARDFGKGAASHLFYTRSFLAPLVDGERWDSAQFLPWPRFHPLAGPFGRLRRARANLDVVAFPCRDAGEIRLHMAVMDTEANNYHVNHLRRSFPRAAFSVRLLPDGILNLRRHPMGLFKEIGQYGRKLRRLACPSLDYHPLRGDRTGSDDPLVDRIYLLPGMPHQYDSRKVAELAPFPAAQPRTGGVKKALVLGQPLSSLGHISPGELESVSAGMEAFLRREGVEVILYKRHPRDARGDFLRPGYRELALAEPLESHLMRDPYDLVVGATSTGLLTARMILGERSRSISYGMNMLGGRGRRDSQKREELGRVFRAAGIEVVDHPPGGIREGFPATVPR
jgi:hypothetical protein